MREGHLLKYKGAVLNTSWTRGQTTVWPPLSRARPIAGTTICFSVYRIGERKLGLTFLFSLGTFVYKVNCLFSEGFGFNHSY